MKSIAFSFRCPALRRLTLGMVAAVLAGTGLAAELPSALTTDASGWTDLLPAADLNGWTRMPFPNNHSLGRAQWHLDAARQVLVCDGDGGHDILRFDRELTNAIFHVECRFVPVTGTNRNYNSGIFIRNSADGTVWHQCQLTLNGGFLFGNTPVGGQFKKFNAHASERRMKPAGEWNTVEVTARGPALTVWFNGAVVSELDHCEMPAGFIGLESEGYAIEFRNLKLKELP